MKGSWGEEGERCVDSSQSEKRSGEAYLVRSETGTDRCCGSGAIAHALAGDTLIAVGDLQMYRRCTWEGGEPGAGRRRTLSRPKCGRRHRRRHRRGNGIPEKVVCGNSLRIRGKRMAVAEENMSVVVRGEKVLISLSLPLDSRLSFLRAIAGNELVGKSAVTLVTSGLRLHLRSGLET